MTCRKSAPQYKAQDLNRRIAIQRKTRTADGQGGFTESWYDDGFEWAMWTPLSGNQRWNAMRVGSEVRVRAIIRFRGTADGTPYYSAKDRVSYLGRTYGIDAVIDIGGEGRFLELQLTESAPS